MDGDRSEGRRGKPGTAQSEQESSETGMRIEGRRKLQIEGEVETKSTEEAIASGYSLGE